MEAQLVENCQGSLSISENNQEGKCNLFSHQLLSTGEYYHITEARREKWCQEDEALALLRGHRGENLLESAVEP